MRLLWKLLWFVVGLVFFYLILRWIGFDMNELTVLWQTFLQMIRDLGSATKGILN